MRLTEEQMERLFDVISNLVVTVLVIATLFEDLGINIVELLMMTPEMLRHLLERYFTFFWMCHLTLLAFVAVEGYIAPLVRNRYPEAYKTRYLPAVATVTFILAFISFLAFRRPLDLFLMICSVAVVVARGG